MPADLVLAATPIDLNPTYHLQKPGRPGSLTSWRRSPPRRTPDAHGPRRAHHCPAAPPGGAGGFACSGAEDSMEDPLPDPRLPGPRSPTEVREILRTSPTAFELPEPANTGACSTAGASG